MRKTLIILFLGSALVLSIKNAYSAGSGAYRLEVPDAEAMGKGSAFVAQADNPSAVYYNPAGLTQLKGKAYVSVGTAVIQPLCTYKDTSGNETDRRKQTFVIPHTYFVSDFGLEKFTFGLGATSYWGLGTWWAEDSFSRYVSTKADYSTQDAMITGAYEINEKISLGIGVDYTGSYANKKKKLLQGAGLVVATDGDFQLKAKDVSAWGYRLSTLYKINEKHQLGLMYRSEVDVKYKGKIYLNDLNAALSVDLSSPADAVPDASYQTIFGGTSYETDITSKSTLPQSIVLGYCYKPNDKWKLETDIEWMDWSSVQEEKIDYPSGFGTEAILGARSAVLNNGNPTPKNWHSAFSCGLGAEYKVNDKWKLRGGYFYHQSPIAGANFETSLPDSDSHSVTTGLGYKFNKDMGLDFAYAAMFFNKRGVRNTTGASSGASINGDYESFINVYMLTFSFKL
ncbi:MAG: OmpP1/FadL family transporter [Candidatus Omnitrophica bacterium]|nr:OmpP1/FadL family transporter [Candidatus Omnitrophota bacterium]